MENVQTVDSTKKHFPVAILKESIFRELIALQPIALIIISECLFFWAEPAYAIRCAQPEVTGIIFEDAIDEITRQSVIGSIGLKFFFVHMKVAKTVCRAKPDSTLAIFVDVEDIIGWEAVRIVGIRTIGDEAPCFFIVQGQSFFPGCHP